MAKFIQEIAGDDGWSRWIPPLMRRYKMACCDCGLVHDTEFDIVKVEKQNSDGSWEHSDPMDPEKYRVLMRVRRNNRSTAGTRRYAK